MSISTVRKSPAELGRLGEAMACDYVSKCLGWQVVDRNVRTRYGELDIVARTPIAYVFIEVRSRRGHRYGRPLETVDPHKLAKLMQQMLDYAARHQIAADVQLCLDVIGFTFDEDLLESVEHVRVLP